jgi:heme/copper-type cytochrome/quinol oxidase subunit 2
LSSKDQVVLGGASKTVEVIWTLIPAAILWTIGVPSLRLLYTMDELLDAAMTVKVVGNQWYWSYEYADYGHVMDSFMLDDDSETRLLAVDNYLVLPLNSPILFLLTSNDVIHSFGLTPLCVKCDAIPGRLNSLGLIITRPATYYGMCSELCGVNHGFMPIGLHAVSLPSFTLSPHTCITTRVLFALNYIPEHILCRRP